MKQWSGVFPAITTQFFEDGSLDLAGTARQVDTMIASGSEGIVALGSLGENNALAPHEKAEVVREVVRTAAGRAPVISGVSELNLAACLAHVRAMEAVGVDGFMILPAMAYKADADEALPFFRAVGQSTDRPIILYNNPIAYHVDLRPEHLEALADQPNFVAVKESSGDTRRFTDIMNRLGDRYALFAGVDDLIFECVALGAVGWIAGICLAFPNENQALWDAMRAGRWDEAQRLYRWFTPVAHLDVGVKFVQKIKLAMQETGMGTEWVREPRYALTGAEREATLQVVRHAVANRPALPVIERS